jgi:hypothetical protein
MIYAVSGLWTWGLELKALDFKLLINLVQFYSELLSIIINGRTVG